VPVRGAVSATGPKGEKLIVARPDQDTAVAFSAICTHQGCTVAPSGSQLHCPCHGSVYDALTGKNVSGPAPRPLATFAVRVKAGEVVADQQ
jgi:Rieske Fe-S protein